MIITFPEVLRDKLGVEGARALADLLNETNVSTRENVTEIAADRFERRLAEESAKLRAEIGSLRADMGAFKGRITRWMFVFWIGQIGALLGISSPSSVPNASSRPIALTLRKCPSAPRKSSACPAPPAPAEREPGRR